MSGIQNKRIIVSIVLIVIASLVGLYLFYKLGNKNKKIDISGEQYEASFEKEGQLAFVKKNSNDTLMLINIEMANNEEERTQGLMWWHSMPDSNGMLFVFEEERPLSFWMKNTYIPLDIIYVNKKREIVTIRHNTIPLSEMPIPSGKPAQYVIEVNAWFCVNHGINVGDRIIFDTIK